MSNSPSYNGTVKSYNLAAGFGFITCSELNNLFDRDVFFNRCIEGIEKTEVGLQVSFLLTISDQNKPQATDLKLHGSRRGRVMLTGEGL